LIANTATKNLVKKLQKKYNKEDIVVIKRVNQALVVTEGNMKNIKVKYCITITFNLALKLEAPRSL
jgi:hypothetical protein